MFAHPELEDRLLAAMNYDMPATDLEKTDSYLRMKMTPDSVPSFLNDLVANLLLFVDQTEIRTPTGNNAPFNYRLVPFISNSDHMVFLAAGIPAMQFNHWPDNFYHSSADTAEMTDPTEGKRIGFVGAAAFYHLANAGPAEQSPGNPQSAGQWISSGPPGVRLAVGDAGTRGPFRGRAAKSAGVRARKARSSPSQDLGRAGREGGSNAVTGLEAIEPPTRRWSGGLHGTAAALG
jgi:hypothetical protein